MEAVRHPYRLLLHIHYDKFILPETLNNPLQLHYVRWIHSQNILFFPALTIIMIEFDPNWRHVRGIGSAVLLPIVPLPAAALPLVAQSHLWSQTQLRRQLSDGRQVSPVPVDLEQSSPIAPQNHFPPGVAGEILVCDSGF
jgi:hypothetical protein